MPLAKHGYDPPMRYGRVLATGVAVLVAAGAADAGASASAASCRRTYPDLSPYYRRLVIVRERRGLTCSQAASIGSDVATLYERGLPVADYPPPPAGVPGGKSQPFGVATALGKFTCHMTARGSDFVDATCSRRTKSVRFESLDHYYLR